MNAEDFASTVRSAPPWLTISLIILAVVLLVGGGPVAGLVITHRRHKEVTRALAAKTGGAPELSWMSLPVEAPQVRRSLAAQPFGALDVTFAGVPAAVDSSPTMLLNLVEPEPEPATEPVPLSEEPSVPIEPNAPVSEPTGPVEEQGMPEWATMTAEFDVVAVLEAEVIEAEDEATKLFRADPLRSWVMPPLEEMDFLPEADRVFRDLVARNWLTGEGAEISADWEPWYSDSRELEGASA